MMTMAAELVGRCSIGGGSVEFSHFQPPLQPVFALAGIEIRGSPMVHILWVFVPVPHKRLFTAQELAIYNGTDDGLPILLAILGSVFDVTKGKSHYGAGGGYNHFAGRDASRAFVSGNFTGDGLSDSMQGLSSTEVKSVVDWRDFYFRTYIAQRLWEQLLSDGTHHGQQIGFNY